jgi:hypothetical protein
MKIPMIPSIWKYIGMGLIALALVASIVFGVRGCAQDEREENNQLVNQGVVIEREAEQREVLNNVKEARDAVDNPTGNDLNVVCEKYNRNC